MLGNVLLATRRRGAETPRAEQASSRPGLAFIGDSAHARAVAGRARGERWG